jgi:hypothetical protein
MEPTMSTSDRSTTHRRPGIGPPTPTELTDHITHAETKAGAEQMYEQTSITAQDIAEVIAFAVSRPHSASLNRILIRPTGQATVMHRSSTRHVRHPSVDRCQLDHREPAGSQPFVGCHERPMGARGLVEGVSFRPVSQDRGGHGP